jgi:hypothetical protein
VRYVGDVFMAIVYYQCNEARGLCWLLFVERQTEDSKIRNSGAIERHLPCIKN